MPNNPRKFAKVACYIDSDFQKANLININFERTTSSIISDNLI